MRELLGIIRGDTASQDDDTVAVFKLDLAQAHDTLRRSGVAGWRRASSGVHRCVRHKATRIWTTATNASNPQRRQPRIDSRRRFRTRGSTCPPAAEPADILTSWPEVRGTNRTLGCSAATTAIYRSSGGASIPSCTRLP